MTPEEVLALCVGDTIDAPRRSAFPKNRAELESRTNGKKMFKIAREALESLAPYNSTYKRVAQGNKNKFCRGYGIFQYDLQFFKNDPDFFLKKQWVQFEHCASRIIKELHEALGRQSRRSGWGNKTSLTDLEMVMVAIAYNKGSADPRKGIKQGYKPDGGKYYGENIQDFLKFAKTVNVGAGAPKPASAKKKTPAKKAAAPAAAEGATAALYSVNVSSSLNLREKPNTSCEVLASMRAGQIVQRLSGADGSRFWKIEANINGKVYQGYAASKYLKPVTAIPAEIAEVPVVTNFKKDVPKYITSELEPPTGVVGNGASGMRVKRIQEWLCFHDCKTGIDGGFGRATARAVKKFQQASRLPVTGKVNAKTWEALVKPMKQALAQPKKIKSMSLPEAILAVANQHVNVHPVELGGDNRGPWVRLYCNGNDGRAWAWCAGFVSTIMHQACYYRGENPPIKGSVSCDQLASQAKAAGLFISESEITSGRVKWSNLDGCALFLRRKSSTDWTHTGFATEAEGSKQNLAFDTIEGNTNDEGSREGFEACRRTRSVAKGEYDFVRFV